QVGARDPDLVGAVLPWQEHAPVQTKRLVVLGDLVALRIVGVEVVLAVEYGVLGDRAVECEPEPDPALDRLPVRDRKCPGVGEADWASVAVLGREVLERAPAEHLRPRLQVDMDLEPDYGFPVHRKRSGTQSNSSARSSACPARKSVFSENCGPISCRPTGKASERPHGIESPGIPAMFEGIVSTSARYIASGFSVRAPGRNATVGEVGDASRSKRSKRASCSRLINVRTFWACP